MLPAVRKPFIFYHEKVAKPNMIQVYTTHNYLLSFIKLINLHSGYMDKTDHFLPLFLRPEPPKDPFCDALALSSLSACFTIPGQK